MAAHACDMCLAGYRAWLVGGNKDRGAIRRLSRGISRRGIFYFGVRVQKQRPFYGMQATGSRLPICNLLEFRRLQVTSECLSHSPRRALEHGESWNMWLCNCATQNQIYVARVKIHTVVSPLSRHSRTIFAPSHAGHLRCANDAGLVLKIWCLYAPPNASSEVLSWVWHFFLITPRFRRILFGEANILSTMTASAAFVI